MDELITIMAKTVGGNLQEFRVREIVSIDGQPWQGTAGDWASEIAYLSGRIDQLQNTMTTVITQLPGVHVEPDLTTA